MNSTSSHAAALPESFVDLNHWADTWALPTEEARYFHLLSLSIDELRPFHEAMLDRAPAVIAYLDRQPLYALSPQDQTLLDLLLTFVETAHPIELRWQQTDIESPVDAERLRFHGPSASRYAFAGPATTHEGLKKISA